MGGSNGYVIKIAARKQAQYHRNVAYADRHQQLRADFAGKATPLARLS